jgi:hypothetical protein
MKMRHSATCAAAGLCKCDLGIWGFSSPGSISMVLSPPDHGEREKCVDELTNGQTHLRKADL